MRAHNLHDVLWLQEQAAAWDKETFGEDVYKSRAERALRTLEEALEYAQAAGVEITMARKITDHVYTKFAGKPEEEILDVFLCLLVAADREGVDLATGVRKLLDTVWQISGTIHDKYKIKVELGLTQFEGELGK